MNTVYDILGVSRRASEKSIKAAYHRAAKACHPDLNASDPTAEERLRQAIAAYDILKSPQRRAAYDQYLRDCRRQQARRFMAPIGTGLVSGLIVALVIWLALSPSRTQVVSASHERPVQLTREWQQIKASSDPKAIWAFAVRNPDAPESALARSKLVELIDVAIDVPLLQVLDLVASDPIAQRARERLARLDALAAKTVDSKTDTAKADHTKTNRSGSTPVPTVQASVRKSIEEAPREAPLQDKTTAEAPREAPLHLTNDKAIAEARREQTAVPVAVENRTIREARRVEPALQAVDDQTIEEAKHEKRVVRPPTASARSLVKRPATGNRPVRQASSESGSPCSEPCSRPVSTLFGVGF
jgi:curved DNA-binding protein CbpA